MKLSMVFLSAAIAIFGQALIRVGSQYNPTRISLQNSKLTTNTSDKPVYSVWGADSTCGGLKATIWSDAKGWHSATCMEMAIKLSDLRDVREVSVSDGPDIPGMLAYSQYEEYFRIDRKDFEAAQNKCRHMLSEKMAVQDILDQCKRTVAGVVPYGLKLK